MRLKIFGLCFDFDINLRMTITLQLTAYINTIDRILRSILEYSYSTSTGSVDQNSSRILMLSRIIFINHKVLCWISYRTRFRRLNYCFVLQVSFILFHFLGNEYDPYGSLTTRGDYAYDESWRVLCMVFDVILTWLLCTV